MTEAFRAASALEILISSADVDRRVTEMGRQISADYQDSPLLILIVLRGAFVFASDLIRRMDSDIDLEIAFVRASSYGDSTVSSGEVTLDLEGLPAEGRHVLVVEDIIDTGRTVSALSRLLKPKASSFEVAALLSKQSRRTEPLSVRYTGFEIPDVFVVGYGLDYAQQYRQLPDIRILQEQ